MDPPEQGVGGMDSLAVKARAVTYSAAMLLATVGMERASADAGKPVGEVRAAEQAPQDQKAIAGEECAAKKAGSNEPDDLSKEPDPPNPLESAAEQRQRGKDVFKDVNESARRTTLCATLRVRK
jgi:hypothetical protein